MIGIANARRLTAPGILAIITFACSQDARPNQTASVDSAAADSTARAKQDSVNRTLPGYVVDSILPVDEELRRFRVAIGGDSVATLENSAPSRDTLVKRFMTALAASDSMALRKMLLNSQEFAWLIYPESRYTSPPYTQSPALVWNQIQNPAASGFTRLVRRLGGKSLQYEGYECPPKPDREGRNVIWTSCTVRAAEPNGAAKPLRLFGSIIERDGRFKFVSYANEF